MKTDLVRPCKDCPFRNDIPGFLDRARARDIARALKQDQSFSCHRTNEFTDDGEARETKHSQHCAGAMIMLERIERPNQWMRIMERLGFYDHTKLEKGSPVFRSFTAFVQHHAIVRGRKIGSRRVKLKRSKKKGTR